MFISDFNFNKTGTKELKDFTKKCLNQKIGLLINNNLIFAALSFGPIENGEIALSGNFTENDIDNMRLLIENAIKKFKELVITFFLLVCNENQFLKDQRLYRMR